MTGALLPPATALVALLAVVVVVAAFTIFTHTGPLVPVSGDLVGNCDENEIESFDGPPVQLGIDGRLKFRCIIGSADALTVSSGPIEMEPLVTLGGYSQLFITRGTVSADDCTTTGTGSESKELFNGVGVTMTDGDYNYCARYVNPSTINLAVWSVIWGV